MKLNEFELYRKALVVDASAYSSLTKGDTGVIISISKSGNIGVEMHHNSREYIMYHYEITQV